MPTEFSHFLVTRYNVPFEKWSSDKAGNQVGHDEWMHQRLALFKKYCVPTIMGQSIRNFQWLIYLDSATAAADIKAITTETGGIENTALRFAEDMNGLLDDLRNVISTCATDFIITSRLDNDDGLGKDFIRNVQEAFLHQNRLLINMDHGVVYDTDKRILTELRKAYLNHFTSLVEKRSAEGLCLTVLGFAHTEPPSDVVVLNLHTKYSWLKIIHDRNLNSRTKGKPVPGRLVLPYFNLTKKDFPVSIIQTAFYVVKKGIQRMLKPAGKKKR